MELIFYAAVEYNFSCYEQEWIQIHNHVGCTDNTFIYTSLYGIDFLCFFRISKQSLINLVHSALFVDEKHFSFCLLALLPFARSQLRWRFAMYICVCHQEALAGESLSRQLNLILCCVFFILYCTPPTHTHIQTHTHRYRLFVSRLWSPNDDWTVWVAIINFCRYWKACASMPVWQVCVFQTLIWGTTVRSIYSLSQITALHVTYWFSI